MRHRDGHWVWILSRARIERDPQRNAVRFVGCHLDTMARKDADATIRDHRDALVHEAEIRTAEAANRAKSAFLGNMSHELRTPPHSVLSFARLGAGVAARGESAPEKLARFFGNIEQSATRLHASLDRAPSIVDAAKVSQVLRELQSTAIRYSPDDTTVQVRLRDEPVTDQTDSPGRALRIEVIDEGLGIPEAELSTVFDRFVEGSKTRSSAGGTGLGLAICREVVSLYGGRIWAERNVTRGTTIVAVLPQPADAPQIAG
jgi:signal transduction histidine kinase